MKTGLVLVVLLASFPFGVNASIFSIFPSFYNKKEAVPEAVSTINSQNLAILKVTRNANSELARGGGDITVINGSALMPESGPVGTMVDVVQDLSSDTISAYVVRKGDSLGLIAAMFDVSVNTVRWANDISGSIIHEGDVLVILPISGVEHTAKKGDTINSIAKLYKADAGDISKYNNISENQKLAIGDVVIVPDGEIASPSTSVAISTSKLRGAGGPSYDEYYLRPVMGGRKSQGLHGYNGVDLATYAGAPVFASAEGVVIVSSHSGWNGGYGKYAVIAHPNGTQTLYAHMSENFVNVGDMPVRGQTIGLVGSTGKSTGSHLHFEIRGAKNPF